MSNISDLIESYIKRLLEESPHDCIEVQRNELALKFNCVPSQINYVLATRFSAGRGYLVESRRGGGGYIRIMKIPLDQRADLLLSICGIVGESISQAEAEGMVDRLLEEGIVTPREALIMKAAVNRDVLRAGLPFRDSLRASILKAMVTAVLRKH